MSHLDMGSLGAGLAGPPYQGDLKPGDIYRVIRPFITKAGRAYEVWDKLELIEPTGRTPFRIAAIRGINWVVKCKHF